MAGTNNGRYTFEVAREANKLEIAEAVAEGFNVDVVDVHVMIVKGKTRRYGRRLAKKPDWKKAIVTLAEGQKIERYFVEGV
ncbi:MAG: 50S ribosomal protein L23 [Chloroflexota bacterium]|nr:50S ribosomal protein L23 [Chloroflexota bacterium]